MLFKEYFLLERKSLEEKSIFIQKWYEEALDKIRKGDFIVCSGLKMSFGKLYGIKVVGEYNTDIGFRNVYYFGVLDDEQQPSSATGRADIIDIPTGGKQGGISRYINCT